MNCPKCNAPVQLEDHFCEECGFNINTSAARQIRRITQAADTCLAVVSDIGKKHQTNQDAGKVGRGKDDIAIMVVSDGVSTAFNPEMASTTVVSTTFNELIHYTPENDSKECMKNAIQKANMAAVLVPGAKQTSIGSEATIVAAIVQGMTATIGWVGDSRAYVIGNGNSRLVTLDDSWLTIMLQRGKTYEEAIQDPRAHAILQCLGMLDDEPDIHVIDIEMEEDEALLLCTDGLWNYYSEPSVISSTIDKYENPGNVADICNYLVELGNAAGGHDNITVAMLLNS